MHAGRLFTVVGPSGVGKDSLLRAAKAHYPRLHLVRRVITRPTEAGGEDFEGVTQSQFDARLARNGFALHWQAHGLRYGIPSTLHEVLADGRDAVFNGSRAMLPDAQRAFPGLIVIHVTARPEILATRLAARGRETADDIARRLARATLGLPHGLRRVIEIDNSGRFEDGVAALRDALQPASV